MSRGNGGPRKDPDPVVLIIATRTAQVSGTALLALAGLRVLLPPERLRPFLPWGSALVTAGMSAYFIATFTAGVPCGAPVITRLPPDAGNAVALTFDDGPHPDTTPRLLDLLNEQGAKATFFVLGEAAARFPELVRRIRAEGHGIGVHGLRHRTMALQSAHEIAADLLAARALIEAASPTPPGAPPLRLLRPPYGFKTLTVSRVAARLGFVLTAWSVDPRDYDSITAETLYSRVTTRLQPRDIVLLHERRGVHTTVETLPRLLRFCVERGWRCVPME